MGGASILSVLLIIWAGVTLVFGALMMWKYLVGMREDNMVILDANEAAMAAEQQEITAKVQRIGGLAKIFGFLSLALLLAVLVVYGQRVWVTFNGG